MDLKPELTEFDIYSHKGDVQLFPSIRSSPYLDLFILNDQTASNK